MNTEYPIVVNESVLKNEVVEERKQFLNLAKGRNWDLVLEFLKENGPSMVNTCTLPVDESSVIDLNTVLHWAARGRASEDIFKELIAMGASKSLKNANGETAFDIAKSEGLSQPILDILSLPQAVKDNEKDIDALETGLHKAINGRVADLIKKNGMRLPQVPYVLEFGQAWYPVPGMYGGFNITTHEKGLVTESWCRVAGGSGQRHVIDRTGNVELVDEGFV